MSWFLLGSLAVVSMYWLWRKIRRPYTKYSIPPFPAKPWPGVGHFLMMFGDFRENMKLWRKETGDIYSLDVVGELNILLHNFNDIKEIWVKHADLIPNLQHSFGDDIIGEDNKGIIGAKDDNWRKQRTASMSILRSLGMGKNTMAVKIQEEVSVFLMKLVAFKGQPQDIKTLLNISVANVICSVTVGKRFEHEDPYFIRLVGQVNTMMKYVNTMFLLTSFQQLYSLPGDIFNAKKWRKATVEITEEFCKPFIYQLKQGFNKNEEPENFIASYLKEMKKDTNSLLDEANLTVIIRTLFVAGTETASTAILWCVLYMLHHPQIQENVYREIEAQVGTDRVPNMADRPKLTYLNAVIMETLRFASISATGFRREVIATFEHNGFTFPKGCIIWPVLDSVHHDEKIWGDPYTFRPERFIDEHGALINREELIPFSLGTRACMGEALARMELFLFLSAMFQRFKFEPDDSSRELPTLKESFGTTLVPHPFKLKFIERKL